MLVRMTQLDGKLPNLALMKLAHWHRARGDEVVFRGPGMGRDEAGLEYGAVYGSSIFRWSAPKRDELLNSFPGAMIAGTGTDNPMTVEEVIGEPEYEHYDYTDYPAYQWSIGFTMRGCRLRCGFCVVPKKEGGPREVNTIYDIWRPGTPRCVVLLDNDFFGQPREAWEARAEELKDGGFRVAFNQGINVRLINPELAAVLASLDYADGNFRRQRLYTAWDNLGQERVFFRGLEHLVDAGIPASHVMVYMLTGWAKGETMDDVLYRYRRLKEAGCRPWPMVYDRSDRERMAFQKWVNAGWDGVVPWAEFRAAVLPPERSGKAKPRGLRRLLGEPADRPPLVVPWGTKPSLEAWAMLTGQR